VVCVCACVCVCAIVYARRWCMCVYVCIGLRVVGGGA
jgi:hypothetical protein